MASTEPAAKKSLVLKLSEVMGEVERVPKSGRNEFHRYDYATEADIVAAVRGGLASRGVMLIPSITKCEWSERSTKSGVTKVATITVRFTFLDGESDQRIEFDGMGQGEDASDKAVYKAMTGAEKYALLKTFLIPTGDDPEADSKPSGRREAPRNTSQRTEAPKPPPPAPAAPAAPVETAEQKAHRARAGRIWKLAESRGCKPVEFPKWIEGVLGRRKESKEWDVDDMSRLEVAFSPEPPAGEPF